MLNTLTVHDPFEMTNSQAVVEYSVSESANNTSGIIIGVQDLYYSLPHDPLMQCVSECIPNDNDEVGFRNICGMMVKSFMTLLHFYINNTHVAFCEKQDNL